MKCRHEYRRLRTTTTDERIDETPFGYRVRTHWTEKCVKCGNEQGYYRDSDWIAKFAEGY